VTLTAVTRVAALPLGNYLRPGRNDHLVIHQLASESLLKVSGLVVDPTLLDRQGELVREAARLGIETVLDPRSMDLASGPAFGLSGVSDLPWASPRPHIPEDLEGASGLLFAESLSEFAVKEELSALMAPTHIIADVDDAWLTVDGELVRHLRRALDSRHRADTPIYYPLAIRATVFTNEAKRDVLIHHLSQLPIDAVWLRIHPFGTTSSGPLALRRYIQGCWDLHRLGLPLLGEHTGTVGVALLAFGAVGGVESGITLGERFEFDRYLRPREGNGFSPPPRVYFDRLGSLVDRQPARSLLQHRGMRPFLGCQDQQRCCRRGYEDMINEPRRHFIIQRTSEIDRISQTPPQLRAAIYMDEFLRPASDAAVRAAKAEPGLESTRRRLDSWRGTLSAILADGPPASVSLPAVGRVQLLPE
jgi:hypothetical protein